MNIAERFGLGELAPQIDTVVYPAPVAGRIAHIDADFMAYQVSAEHKDELDGLKPRRTLDEMYHNAHVAADHLMRLVGATSYVCHITPSGSNKGNRHAQAVQQEYQANRADKVKPEHLNVIRAYIGLEMNGVVHLDQEADDGLAQANWNAVDWNLSVIVSKDKDLRMVPGLHWDFDTDKLVLVEDTFGSIWVDGTGSSKKLRGWGTKFFWAQCLMGDTADNIKGLPAVAGPAHCRIMPTGTYTLAKKQLEWGKPEHHVGPLKLIASLEAKTKPCGPVMTYQLLRDVGDDATAFKVVKALWNKLASHHGYQFEHWQTGVEVTPTQALLGDMQLLWMRRNKNPMDVVHWLKEQTA